MTAVRVACRVAAPILLVVCLPGAALSQPTDAGHAQWHTSAWVGDLTFLSANALLAGLSAGVVQEVRGHSFRDGFARGALGGAIAYGGRRVAVENFHGAGFLGRQLSAVGSSLARNAGNTPASFSDVTLPLGPVLVHLRNDNGWGATATLDLYSAAWLATAIMDDRLALDVGETLSSGAPVFRAADHDMKHDGTRIGGTVVGGVIVVARPGQLPDDQIMRHERVHVLQYDFGQTLLGDQMEQYASRHLPFMASAQKFVRFGVAVPVLLGGLYSAFDLERHNDILEIEAHYLDSR